MNITLGVLAHVDAGKTTFCEQLLVHANILKTPGRVDHGDSFMDTHPLERERGITIFSAQASFSVGQDTVQLLDTPGHADFCGEMERSLSVADLCVLILSCAEGIQSHTRTLWHLLEKSKVPVLLFLNKTDRLGADKRKLLKELKESFSGDIVSFDGYVDWEDWAEEVAERDDRLLEKYLSGTITKADAERALSVLFLKRGIFPALSGSALNDVGISELLGMIPKLTAAMQAASEQENDLFSAKCYKVRIDEKIGRLAYLRVLNGTISARKNIGDEKVTAVYAVQGAKMIPVEEVRAGMLCAVQGLSCKCGTIVGGKNPELRFEPQMEPMLVSSVTCTGHTPPPALLKALRTLEEEEPLLHVEWHAKEQFASVSIMGAVQLEIIQKVLSERFHIEAYFGECRVIYREKPGEECMGVGHYEPLRHYAEVRLMLKPMPSGSGITFESLCHVDFLSAIWQKQIKEILLKEPHYGVLTGSALTDTAIILLNGRAHLKHTEGGDFREAARRAVRNALMRGNSILLEPYCRFSVQCPKEFSKVILERVKDLRAGSFHADHTSAFSAEGECPVSTFLSFLQDLPSMTKGMGSAWWENVGYRECHNASEVIEKTGYLAEADTEQSPDSVFCQKGAGFTVKWDHVEEWAHTAAEAHY